MSELKNKVILITGASSGIGLATGRVCANRGASTILSSLEKDVTDSIIEELPGGHERHASVQLDVTKKKDRERAFDSIRDRYGRLDGLVNNAGIDFNKPFLSITEEEWRRVFSIDLDAVFHLCQKAISWFLSLGGGSIVNVSSVHTLSTYSGSVAYAAAKNAVNQLTRGLACEFAEQNIRVNCVAPGVVRTGIWDAHIDHYGGDREATHHWARNIPVQRILEPEEIGEVISFLLSDRARGLHGSVIYIDGGLTSQLIAR